MRRRLTIALLVVLVLALLAAAVVVGVRWWRDEHQSTFERATAFAPYDAQRLSWTDWAGVREKVGVHLDTSSSAKELGSFLDDGYEKDLTSASALVQSAPVLQRNFDFSPATIDWELFSQAEDGAVVIMGMPDDTDFDHLADQLDHAGYTRPSAGEQVWMGGEALLPAIGAGLTPELQYVALDPDDHLVLTSDEAAYLQQVTDGLGAGDLSDGMAAVVPASGTPLSASVYDGHYTCSALAMSGADAADEEQGKQLVREAGGVNPMTGFAMSVQPGGHVRVVMSFETDDQARENADSRARLAGGPAPGQGGDFSDRFTIASATADGPLVTLDLVPKRGTYVFSDLSTGPVLFATC